jgi:peptide/nickel transport system ATP-binding protein
VTASVLETHGITAHYASAHGPDVQAVDSVSIQLRRGEVLGLAGESGCGKSTFASVVAMTARPPLYVLAGDMVIEGTPLELTHMEKLPRELRGKLVSLLPQGAMNSLNPTARVRDLAYDVLRAHDQFMTRREAADRTRERLERLSLPARVMEAYPHQLSGGMRQRTVAVVSTLLNPTVLVADEPTSALDVSAQRALVQLLRELLEQELVRAILFITHDLALLSTLADRIAIMYAGRLAEVGPTRDIVDRPRHPYTRALMQTVLTPDRRPRGKRVEGIPGEPPDLRRPPAGCRYNPRCSFVMDVCRHEDPPVVGDDTRFATCWWVKDHPAEDGSSLPPATGAATSPARGEGLPA